VIVSLVHGGGERLEVHDLDSIGAGATSRLWIGSSESAYLRDEAGFSHEGRYMASRRQEREGAVLGVAGIDPALRSWLSVPLPVLAEQVTRVRFSPRDDYVVVSVYNEDGINRGNTQAIHAAARTRAGTLGEAKRVAVAAYPYNFREAPTVALPHEGSFLVYVNGAGELRAVYYDGTNEAIVAGGVRAVWSLKSDTDLSWWR
jgi:hypothetical protein